MKKLLSLFLAASVALTIPSCGEKEEDPTPSVPKVDTEIAVYLERQTTTGNTGVSGIVATVGIAKTEADAQAARGTELTATINSADAPPSQAKILAFAGRTKGEKLWLFARTNQPLTGTQKLQIIPRVAGQGGGFNTLTYSPANAPAGEIVVREITIP